MTLYRFGTSNRGILISPTMTRSVTFPSEGGGGPTLTPVPLDAKMAASGHSILDAFIKYPLSGVIVSAGLTPDIISATGPYATAQIRWNSDPASPDSVRAALTAAGPTTFKLFLGIEAHGGDYGTGPSRASVQTHYQYSDARGYALLWHNLAASKGAQTGYANFCRDDTTLTFGASWRASHNVVVDAADANMTEIQLWDAIIDHVNANRTSGTPPMRLVPFIQVFLAIYDAIEAGTVTGITMASLFSDNVHPSATGQWVMIATVLAVMYQRHPDELSNVIPLQYTGTLTISSGLAAQLRPIIWATCLATSRTGLVP